MDTTGLTALLAAKGPFASVYFDNTHDTEDARTQLDLKLREIRRELGDGVDAKTIDAVETAVQQSKPPAGRSGRGLVAASGTVLVDVHLAEPPGEQVARASELPYLVPLALHTDEAPPYLVVVTDKIGADVTRYAGTDIQRHTVTGADHPVHQVRGGGAAHHDIQARTEETVRQNSKVVAEQVAKLAHGAGLVVLAGEVQSRRAVYGLLPEATRRMTTEVDTGSRAGGADNGELDKHVGELLAGRRLAALDDVAERFRAELGRSSGLAVGGLEGVTAALAEANVDTLLIGDLADATTVFAGTGPSQVATSEETVRALSLGHPVRRRANEALPLAAVATGASLVAMDERLSLPEGVGVLLRHN